MKTSINKFLLAFAFGIGFFSWQSCKERTVTKNGLIPDVDNINTFRVSPDSLDISLSTGKYDSVLSNVFSSSQYPTVGLGSIQNDPFFGKISEGIYLQFIPPTGHFYFPSDTVATFDSACISLPYTGFTYGDTALPAGNIQSYKIYRITGDLHHNDSTDYTFTDFAYDPTPIGGGSISLKSITDSFVMGTDDLSNQLRIKLDKNYVYNNIIQTDTSNLTNPSTFTDYFHGCYIKPDISGNLNNRISYFVLAGSTENLSARIDFYFHDTSNAVKVYSFPFSTDFSGYVNSIKRDYTGSPANNFIQMPNNRDSILIQGYPGCYTDITIRNLNKFPPSVINQAQLVLTVADVGNNDNFTSPDQIVMEEVLTGGKTMPIADLFGSSGEPTTGGLNFLGGTPETTTINGQEYTQYKLNFPRELQKIILEGKDSVTLRISAKTLYYGAYRMVAPGFNGVDTNTNLKLNIIYTKTN